MKILAKLASLPPETMLDLRRSINADYDNSAVTSFTVGDLRKEMEDAIARGSAAYFGSIPVVIDEMMPPNTIEMRGPHGSVRLENFSYGGTD